MYLHTLCAVCAAFMNLIFTNGVGKLYSLGSILLLRPDGATEAENPREARDVG